MSERTGIGGLDEVIEHKTVEEARNAAADEVTSTGGRPFPVTVFTQGERLMMSTGFPFRFLRNGVITDRSTKGQSARHKTNRPLDPPHVKAIKNYVLENPDRYILPPVTLNVRKLPTIHLQRSNAAVRQGFMVLDEAANFYVTDGQHRIAALVGYNSGNSFVTGVVDEDDRFLDHALTAQIVYEPELVQVHQDFADAARTKAIPASLLATYNMRVPINRVLAQIVESSIFQGRVDETSKTLSKASQHMFLLNQIRGFVKELLVSDYAMSENTLDSMAKQRIGTVPKQDEFIGNARVLMDVLTENMTPWSQIAKLAPGSDVANVIPDYRQKYINMTATGLVIIGRIAHIINKDVARGGDMEWRKEMYKRLATEIDWRRSGPCWQGTILTSDQKVQTQRGPVKLAVTRVAAQLGLQYGGADESADNTDDEGGA